MSRYYCVPSYRLHKQSSQAIVTLRDRLGQRRDVLLGTYGTSASRAEYARVLAEWEAAGRRLPPRTGVGSGAPADITVNEVILAYRHHAETYYLKNGEPTSQLNRVRLALRPVCELYGHTLACDFGPKALKAVRERMLQMPCGHCDGSGLRAHAQPDGSRQPCSWCRGAGGKGWTRGYINSSIGCIKRMFKWAVAEEILPASVYHGLQAVEGLRKGRSQARETKPVRPVTDDHVKAVLPFLLPPVRAMVEVQLLAGMRPGEVVIMRPCDIDRNGSKTWVYRPEVHKTEHHDITRVVFLGPKAQEVLRPFLEGREQGAYLFSPREGMEMFRKELRRLRKTRVQPSQQDRRRPKPKKRPGGRYTVESYDRALAKACDRAGVPRWTPNQLRHTKATEIRREAGLDTARAVLGHRSPTITETYAEIDGDKAAEIMARLG